METSFSNYAILIGVGVFLLSGDDDLMYFLMVNYVVGDDNSVLLDGDFFFNKSHVFLAGDDNLTCYFFCGKLRVEMIT